MMVLLPDLTEHFAADSTLAGVGVGQQAERGRNDSDAQAIQHGLDLIGSAVDPATGLADPLNPSDNRIAPVVVAQEDAQIVLRAFVLQDFEALDETLLLKEPADLSLDIRGR
jgi:hypothetical protein